jgi:hypothetical protein
MTIGLHPSRTFWTYNIILIERKNFPVKPNHDKLEQRLKILMKTAAESYKTGAMLSVHRFFLIRHL